MGIFYQPDDLQHLEAWPGVTVRVLHGERATMALAQLAPDTVVDEHRHENEQLGMVLQGSARFVTPDDASLVAAGGAYRLLSNVPHRVEVGPQGAVFLECFSPVRSDWERLPRVTSVDDLWSVLR